MALMIFTCTLLKEKFFVRNMFTRYVGKKEFLCVLPYKTQKFINVGISIFIANKNRINNNIKIFILYSIAYQNSRNTNNNSKSK